MARDPKDYPHSELTDQIIGAAMEVHRTLGPGLGESIYENALCLELATRGIFFSQQDQFPISYKGRVVGKLISDLIVEKKVIVENKAVESITDLHLAQLRSYLRVANLKVGLLLNFNNTSLAFRRVANIPSDSKIS
jgi:GxxExxY protein